jgi:dTDP-4-dehydrorhamnose reductase
MRYAVLGAAGQLGSDLCPRLPGEVLPVIRQQVDLTQPATIGPFLDAFRPDVVINCAAYNLVDRAEAEPEAAFAVNAWGVRHLARECGQRDLLLVHLSSDYVFGLDDTRRTPYAESDAPGPVSVYGLSKLAGEYLVRSLCPRHIVIRTCGLYGCGGTGGKGRNFVETMLRLGSQRSRLNVVDDQVCTPSSTVDVAQGIIALLGAARPGIFHLTNSGSTTWFQFARTIFDLSGMNVDVRPIGSREYGAPARRPAYSVLSLDGLRSVGLAEPRPWQEALGGYLKERTDQRP